VKRTSAITIQMAAFANMLLFKSDSCERPAEALGLSRGF